VTRPAPIVSLPPAVRSGGILSRFLLSLCLTASPLAAGDAGDGFALLRKGETAEALRAAEEGLKEDAEDAAWHRLKIEALLAAGRYEEARDAVKPALEANEYSFPLLWSSREALRMGGQPQQAADFPARIERLMLSRTWDYRDDAAAIVILGRAMLLKGTDPKQVLDKFYAVAQKIDPKAREPYLARGELALEKGDGALAARAFRDGLKIHPDDPDMHFGLARAFSTSDRELMAESLKKVLELNPRHLPALLLQADLLIDREDYDGASAMLDKAAEANPHHPPLWALRAVIAHLRNDRSAENKARAAALKTWPGNPEPEFIYGRKLSQKYRFAEGAAAQRRALKSDPEYLPAKAQLANDLLRLGDDDEGWKLAATVADEDAYNVMVFNMMTLRDHMESKFTTLDNGDFSVRMDKTEAAIYGPRVLELLTRARRTLGEKYGIDVKRPTVVEIFTQQKDFGVRTFGMPDNPGYLGVCFGRVVTANSPATNSHPVNWEAVLWHEFCHTVTLQATQNKMPRWLSEGISVYEERQADPSWGERMSPRYRAMILGEDLTPVGQMSGAFLSPKSNEHLMFAYFQSSLVVEHIVKTRGLDAIKAVLKDLADGTTINDALSKHVAPLEKLEPDFNAWAVQQAHDFAPKLNWDQPEPEMLLPGGDDKLSEWSKARPNNYYMLMREAAHRIEDRKWDEAAAALEKIVALHPHDDQSDGALGLLALVRREQKNPAAERGLLSTLTQIDAAVPEANARLIELATDAKDWKTVAFQANRWLAVNPLIPAPWRALAEASEATGDVNAAGNAWRTLLALDPPDPSAIHFNLARLLHKTGDKSAKRHVLMALEDNPRHRGALSLLRELAEANSENQTPRP
jgi:tetratricopeptide (TPR) repeat protein